MGITRVPLSKIKHVANFAIGVLNEYKRRHVASQLIDMAENWLWNVGVSRIEMTVIAANKLAISCYEKKGYKIEGIREKSIKMGNKYYDEIYMDKITCIQYNS